MTMLRTLSRLPSPKFDQQLATGDTHLDQYLQALDAELVGAKMVRNHTLAAVREQLVAQKASLIADGKEATTASLAAVEQLGPAAVRGQAQRQERRAFYVNMMLSTGLPYAVFMTLFNLSSETAQESSWSGYISMFMFYFLFFGNVMAAYLTFGQAPAKTTQRIESLKPGETLEVFSPPASKAAAAILMLLMLFVGSAALLGIFDIGFMANTHLAANLFMVYIAGAGILGATIVNNRLLLQGDTLIKQSLFSRQVIPLTRLVAVEPAPGWQAWFRIGFGQRYILHFCDAGGGSIKTSLILNHEMHNSEQLLTLLQQKVKQVS